MARDLFAHRSHHAPSVFGDPDGFGSLRQEFNRIFGDLARFVPSFYNDGDSDAARFLSPRVNISESENAIKIKAELPGVEEKDINIDLVGDQLTLRAEHAEQKEEKDENQRFHLVESSYGTYFRRFTLPFTPDSEKVSACFNNGVLCINIPHPEGGGTSVKKIAISSGAGAA